MDAREFIQNHADKVVADKIPEMMADLTPESLAQVASLMGSAPNPVRSSTVVPVSEDGDTHVFDVTYSGDDGKAVSLRDTVKQVDGVWKIVNLASPS